MPDNQNAEWLGVIERQQQEIELLRQELAATTSHEDDGACSSPLRCSMGSDSSVASLALSVFLRDDGSQVPIDSERYARICEKMERMRTALAKKSAKLQKARAQCNEGQKLAARLRETVAMMRSETETQRVQLAREHATSQVAVDKAVEKAAQALAKNDLLSAELRKLRDVGVVLREDVCVRSNAVKMAGVAREEMQKELYQTRREAARLASDVRALQNEKSISQSSLQSIQQELAAKRKSDTEWNELSVQKQILQERVNELEVAVQQHVAQVHHQVRLIDQQNRQIQHLKEEQVLVERTFAVERGEDQRHAAHLLKGNISLQHKLEYEQARSHKLHDQAREVAETAQLLAEELLQTKLQVAERDQVLQQRGEKYCELLNAYRGLGRHAQALELSERELVFVLIPTKKRLALLQDTLTRFCYELEGVSKQMVTSRNRSVVLEFDKAM